MKRFFWQMTKRERELLVPLDQIKQEYAVKAEKFMESLPRNVHRLAFYQACDTTWEVIIELAKAETRQRLEDEEQFKDKHRD